MDDSVNLLILHKLIEGLEVTDVHLHELIVRFVLYILEISQITCIRKLVKVDDPVIRIFVHKQLAPLKRRANWFGIYHHCR